MKENGVKYLSVLLLLAALAACAYSPQQITIKPELAVAGDNYGNSRPLAILVEDGRSIKELGSRGGVYKDTSVITIGNSITTAISRLAEAQLASQGFNINSNQADVAQLKIIIDELTYDVPEQSVGKKVLLKAVLRAEATSGGETYTGRYRSNSERQTVITPTMASNEKMINGLLSDTLLRLFTDPKLKAFLSNI